MIKLAALRLVHRDRIGEFKIVFDLFEATASRQLAAITNGKMILALELNRFSLDRSFLSKLCFWTKPISPLKTELLSKVGDGGFQNERRPAFQSERSCVFC